MTPARTPAPSRRFLGQFGSPSPTPPSFDLPEDQPADDTGSFVYGTDINQEWVMGMFRKFVQEFRPRGESQDEAPTYLSALDQRWREVAGNVEGGISFPIQGVHVHEFSAKLY